MRWLDPILLTWLGLASLAAFLLFGYDKYRAARSGRRVSECLLVSVGALGGWPGGWLGMRVFRHKTAKLSFKIKYALGFLVWAGLLCVWWTWR